MGRKPLPDEVKAMRGTLRKCRTSKTETEAPARGVCKPVTKATAPSWLADDARKIFDRTARMLIRNTPAKLVEKIIKSSRRPSG